MPILYSMDSDSSSDWASSSEISSGERELEVDELTETETGEEDDDAGVIFPYRFEPYAEEGEDDTEDNPDRIPQDIDRLQNVEWYVQLTLSKSKSQPTFI